MESPSFKEGEEVNPCSLQGIQQGEARRAAEDAARERQQRADNRAALLAANPPTEKQIAYLRELSSQVGVDMPDTSRMTKREVSWQIDELLDLRDELGPAVDAGGVIVEDA